MKEKILARYRDESDESKEMLCILIDHSGDREAVKELGIKYSLDGVDKTEEVMKTLLNDRYVIKINSPAYFGEFLTKEEANACFKRMKGNFKKVDNF